MKIIRWILYISGTFFILLCIAIAVWFLAVAYVEKETIHQTYKEIRDLFFKNGVVYIEVINDSDDEIVVDTLTENNVIIPARQSKIVRVFEGFHKLAEYPMGYEAATMIAAAHGLSSEKYVYFIRAIRLDEIRPLFASSYTTEDLYKVHIPDCKTAIIPGCINLK